MSFDATTDDFQENCPVFRFPKKNHLENAAKRTIRPRGKLSRISNSQTQSRSLSSKLSHVPLSQNSKRTESSKSTILSGLKTMDEQCPPCYFPDLSSNDDSHISSHEKVPLSPKIPLLQVVDDELFEDISEMEKSVCSSSEKLCPSCKCIVPAEEFSDHLSRCLKKFSYNADLKKETSALNSPSCPVCLKSFSLDNDRRTHIKACCENHGLSAQQLILAQRLQDKQTEERTAIGLPSLQMVQKENESRKKKEGNVISKTTTKDPDLQLAFALSRSLAEEERKEREKEEDRLISLGLNDILQEKRRTLVLPQPPPLPLSGRGSRRGRGKQKNSLQTRLMTRSKEDRERIITEKVAALLVGEGSGDLIGPCRQLHPPRIPETLDQFYDEMSPLWGLSGSGMEIPLEMHFVAALGDFIKPQNIPIGELLKSFSQVPGRLNYTALAEAEDEELSGSAAEGDEDEMMESTVVDSYCTQLALASLLGTQEMLEFSCYSEEEGTEMSTQREEEEGKGKEMLVEMEEEEEKKKEKMSAEMEDEEEKRKEMSTEMEEEEKEMPAEMEEEKDNSVIFELEEERKTSPRSNSDNDQRKHEEDINNSEVIDPDVVSVDATLRENGPEDSPGTGSVRLSKMDGAESTCIISPTGNVTPNSPHSSPFKNSSSKVSPRTLCPPTPPSPENSQNTPLSRTPLKQLTTSPQSPTSSSSANPLCQKLVYDWSSLLASGDHSDVLLLTADDAIPLHTLVLCVRCPEMMKEVEVSAEVELDGKEDHSSGSSSVTKNLIRWNNVAFETAYSFAVYLYCGTCAVKSKEDDLWMGLFDLAIKFNCTELVSYLEDVYKSTPANTPCGSGSETIGKPHQLLPNVDPDASRPATPPSVDAEVVCLGSPSPLGRNHYTPSYVIPSRNSSSDFGLGRIMDSPSESPDIFGDWETNSVTAKDFNETPLGNPSCTQGEKRVSEPFKNLPSSDADSVEGVQEQSFPVEKTPENGRKLISLEFLQKEAEREEERPSFPRRNLAKNFRDSSSPLPSPGAEKELSVSPLDDQAKSPDVQQDPLAELSYVSYPSMSKVIDLTLGSNDSVVSEGRAPLPTDDTLSMNILSNSPTHSVGGGGEGAVIGYNSPVSSVSSPEKADVTTSDLRKRVDRDDFHIPYDNLSPILERPLNEHKGWDSKEPDDFSVLVLTPPKQVKKGTQAVPEIRQPKHISPVINALTDERELRNSCSQSNPFRAFSDESFLQGAFELEAKLATNSTENSVPNGKRRKTIFKSKSCLDYSSKSLESPDSYASNVSSAIKKSFAITPLPDYNAMLSPQLRKELDKYGIRKLSRKKAVKLLLHIYDEMHPLVGDSGDDSSKNVLGSPLASTTGEGLRQHDREGEVAPKERKVIASKTNGLTKPNRKRKEPEAPAVEDLNSSFASTTSVDSDLDCLEETAIFPSLPEDEDVTATQQASFESQVLCFIRRDPELHQKVLLYEPIWANELNQTLKANGVKCSMGKLLDLLDEQCITFRLPTKQRTRKRPRKFSSPGKSPRRKEPKRS